jgi:processive 1,2-diacylglycerol beta-glucosyltransferase
MIKNILIISSNYTGNGHKSISEALCEQFAVYPDIKVTVVDGFSLGGDSLLKVGKSYGTITRNAKGLWQLIWDLSSIKPSIIDELIELTIADRFIDLFKNIKPDLILSLHPNFNGSIINIMEKNKIKIPFITFIADLVSIYPLWADKRADYIISPTIEAMEKCIEFGVPKTKVKVLGFPVRSRFYKNTNAINKHNNYNKNTTLQFLLLGGGDGIGNMSKISDILLSNFNCNVSIVTGHNSSLKKKLEKSLLEKYDNKVHIYGFIENIEELMIDSDIAFTRGSPNVMMEAIACNVPMIITGALPGQEEGNPNYIKKYNIGVVCKNVRRLKSTIDELLSCNASKLIEIKKCQKNYSSPNIAKNIVNFIVQL